MFISLYKICQEEILSDKINSNQLSIDHMKEISFNNSIIDNVYMLNDLVEINSYVEFLGKNNSIPEMDQKAHGNYNCNLNQFLMHYYHLDRFNYI